MKSSVVGMLVRLLNTFKLLYLLFKIYMTNVRLMKYYLCQEKLILTLNKDLWHSLAIELRKCYFKTKNMVK